MKELFPEFFIDTNNLKIETDTLISFDTSALLEIFCCPKNVEKTLFNYINSVKGNIFIPYHVCLEFLNKHKTALRDRLNELDNIENITNKFIENIDEELKKSFKFTSINESSNSKSFKDIRGSIESKIKDWFSEEMTPYFENSFKLDDSKKKFFKTFTKDTIGTKPTQEDIDKIEAEGKKRYDKQTPPGYSDKNKDNKPGNVFHHDGIYYRSMYSDLIIWKQLISKVQDINNEKDTKTKINKVIFVNNDRKKDWFSNKKYFRTELINEFYIETKTVISGMHLEKFISEYIGNISFANNVSIDKDTDALGNVFEKAHCDILFNKAKLEYNNICTSYIIDRSLDNQKKCLLLLRRLKTFLLNKFTENPPFGIDTLLIDINDLELKLEDNLYKDTFDIFE